MNTRDAPTMEHFKAMVQAEWTDPKTIAVWREWRAPFVAQTTAATDAIIQAAQVKPSMQVLDLASGSGEPALTLAEIVGAQGHVTATDLSLGMLAIAEDQARQVGRSNMTFRQADAHALPFPDQTFDRVTCRFGVMYFADAPQALREIYRVLTPGGRVALAAWGALDQNPYMLIALTPFLTRVAVPPPPPGAPYPFKFAAPGSLRVELERAGFQQVQEESLTIPLAWPGPPEDVWQNFREGAVPFHPIFDSLAPDQLAQAIDEVLAGYRQYYDGQRVTMPGAIVVASASR